MPDLDLWQRRVESYMRWLWVRAKVNELVLQTAAPAAPVQLTRQLSTPPSVMPVPQVLDRKGFAAVLGVSVKTIDNMRARGELPPVLKISSFTRSVRWRASDIQSWLDRLPTRR